MDWNEFGRRVRRRGLLRALSDGARPPARPGPGLSAASSVPAAPPAVEPTASRAELEQTAEIPIDDIVRERIAACTVACSAVITGLADLPAVERGGRVIEVALLRLHVRRPDGDVESCVRQHVPAEIRPVLEPGVGVMARAHDHDRAVAVVDWEATGEWVGESLTFARDMEQYDWPPREDWPARGVIEVHDVNGLRARLNERRAAWVLASADLVSLTPLRSRVDRRDEWVVALQMRDGHTVQIKDRTPLLALARLQNEQETRVGTPIDVLVSSDGEVAVDWEATLRALRRRR